MFFNFILLGLFLVFILFIFDFFGPKIKQKYKLYKELKNKRIRQSEFKKKMKKLEIK